MQDALQRIVDPVQARLLQPLFSRQRYSSDSITPDPRPNGRPPRHDRYRDLVERRFTGWHFEVGGMVGQRLSLSLEMTCARWSRSARSRSINAFKDGATSPSGRACP
jgi:hypothetical protein